MIQDHINGQQDKGKHIKHTGWMVSRKEVYK